MEVFIREKNCATCPFANKEKPNFICGDAIANDIGLKTNSSVCKLNYFANEEDCPLKSLDQHDAEVRVEERKKVDIINYENSYSFFLWCETYNKSWFEVKRDTYTKCKDKMREFEDKFGDSIQLEILYLVKASY